MWYHKNWNSPNWQSLKYFVTVAHIPLLTGCTMTITCHTCNIANGRDITTLQMSSFYRSLWAQSFPWIWVSRPLRCRDMSQYCDYHWGPLSATWQVDCWYCAFMKTVLLVLLQDTPLAVRQRFVVSEQHNSSTQCGNVPQWFNMTHPTATTICLWFIHLIPCSDIQLLMYYNANRPI